MWKMAAITMMAMLPKAATGDCLSFCVSGFILSPLTLHFLSRRAGLVESPTPAPTPKREGSKGSDICDQEFNSD